ncbi:MAG TPA: hemerythrin domain-containing protein [Bacteroidota bacterium]|jgi:hemerythrin-like domain-containing protein|nr:hemerythrin domain-containing protein [Bacteroidota bacterium]
MNAEKQQSRPEVLLDPIVLLMHEHEEGMKYLDKLRDAADYIQANGFSFKAFEDVAEAIRFIDNEIRRHNEKEEKYLFPLVEVHVHGPGEVMHNEHRELWRAFKSLRECVKEVEEMKIYPTTVRDLIRLSHAIVDLLSNHIRKENEVFFPMAKNILTKDEYELLTKEMNSIDRSHSCS